MAQAVSFGPPRERFCASLDSPQALGDPGENAAWWTRPSKPLQALGVRC